MNIEENRLRSFDNWPLNTPVNPVQLAHNGFFATSNFFETECNWCHLRINDWRQNEEICDRHKTESPLCIFVLNENCDNVPHQSSSAHTLVDVANCSSKDKPCVDLFVEANRLATFKNWPNPNIAPQSLAKAGFFYFNRSDEVECAWCKGVIAQWEKSDNAFDEHKRFFPDCPRVQLGPLIEMTSEGIRDLGIQQVSSPKKPKFTSLDARLRSYTNWPIGDIQRPEDLAQAGLYYQGVDDQVRCFHCNIGLRSWQKEDDPWFEHAKWYPQCQFVNLVKGASYVQHVQNLTRLSIAQSQIPSPQNMTIVEAMATDSVQKARDMGIDDDILRTVTQKKLTTSGQPYATVEDLLQAIFDEHEEENEPLSNENEGAGSSASIVQDLSRIICNIFGTTDSKGGENTLCDNITASTSSRHVEPSSTATVPLNDKEDKVSDYKIATESNLKQNTFASNISLSLEEENRKLKDARLCKVCLDEEVGVVFLPCGHLVTCVQCAPGVNQCPMCRTDIKGFVRTFLS